MIAYGNYLNQEKIDTKNYNVGIYLRLSKEDEGTKQSESITNQKDFLTRYVIEEGWNIYDTYIDDGYTGTNFDRPDFQRMLEDIKNGKINLVIVKDYSRLGRNYAWTGIYKDEIFPKYNVRFIAVNDNIDTFQKDNSNNDMSAFKGVFNDMYSADISKKIRTSFNVKRKNGEFIGAFAPYGYKKDPNNKNKFIIDEEVSYIVKKIFNMRINGISIEEIMRTLNRENIPCPTKYKEMTSNYKNANIKHYLWRAETIKSILTNPTYAGHMTQRRAEKISYKMKEHRKIPREDWIIVENTHKPIIDKETFEIVQELLNKKAFGRTEKKTEHLLGGLLVCADCGMNITFRREKYKDGKKFITLCSNYSRFHECTRHAVLEEDLNKLVIEDLKSISEKVIKNKKEFLGKVQKPVKNKKNSNIEKLITPKFNRINEIRKIRIELYEDKVRKKISEADFEEMLEHYNSEVKELNNCIASLQNQLKSIEKQKPDCEFYKIIESIVDFNVVDKSILVQLIDKVEIFQNRTIKIYYKFTRP